MYIITGVLDGMLETHEEERIVILYRYACIPNGFLSEPTSDSFIHRFSFPYTIISPVK